MSHFSTIKTKLKDRSIIIEALERLGEKVNQPWKGTSIIELVLLDEVHAENHVTTEVDFSIGVDIGFKLNEKTGEYELIADRQTWDKDIPIERFLEKLTQQYARLTVHESIEEQGFQLQEEWEMDDNSIELTATRWVE
tara:strand:- start:25 stop:438 length:414 start_codon:yes stop_codon:yes gene_type:complete